MTVSRAVPSPADDPVPGDSAVHETFEVAPPYDGAERQAVTRLMQTPEPSEGQIAEVVASVTRTGGLEYARDRAQRLTVQAERELEELPATPAREALRASISYVVERRR